MKGRWDVIVVGGGLGGLSAAALLAKEGRRVLLAEKREMLGGLAAPEEFYPGYRTQGVLLDASGLKAGVAQALDLKRHGLIRREAPAVFIPQAEGPGLVLHRDPKEGSKEISRHSAKDAARYADFRAFVDKARSLISPWMEAPAPLLSARGNGPAELLRLARTGLSLRLMGRKPMLELLRVGPMAAADWLGEWFESELLKAALAAPALIGTGLGPWSAGTAATFLHTECAAGAEVQGGPAALLRALGAAAKSFGVELRTLSAVKALRVEGGKIRGVAFEDGQTLDAPIVVSALDPKTTLLGLVAATELPGEVARDAKAFRARGTAAKVNLALSAPLEFASRPGELFSAARVAETIDDLERAFDAVKYRAFSRNPYLEIRVPTILQPDLAPKGHHVAEILVHCAPYDLKGGWNAENRRALLDAAVETLSRYAPGLKRSILGAQALTPADLHERYGLSGGHIYHGEHALDQLLLLRPGWSCARYATPIEGLFLCGPGCHPGGGLPGMSGILAARTVLAS